MIIATTHAQGYMPDHLFHFQHSTAKWKGGGVAAEAAPGGSV